jgi:hypothetical protein
MIFGALSFKFSELRHNKLNYDFRQFIVIRRKINKKPAGNNLQRVLLTWKNTKSI